MIVERVAAPRLRRRLGRLLGVGSPTSAQAGSGRAPGRVALLESPGFDLAAVAVLKDEASYLEEWLCHHLAVGVQHFFLYDNGSTDDLHAVVEGYVNRGIVTLVYFPMRGLQRDAYNHALRFYGAASEWLAYIDIDEFLVPTADEDVPTILRRLDSASQVLVSRKEFCFSGHRTRPDGLVTEAYRLASRDVPRVGNAEVLAKAIVRSARVSRMGVHSAVTVDRATVNTAGEATPEGRPGIAHPSFANLQINHYYTKSWDEFSRKLARVNTSTHAYRLPEVPFDIPGEPDHAIDRWIPRTRALLERMRQLSPRPIRYGSHLALPDFPRSDQFSVQAASMISNEIAGLDHPRKQRAFDPLPIAGVRGAVARAEDHAYEARPGRLLASVHTRHQVAWLQAAIVWSLPDHVPDTGGGTLERAGPSAGWRVSHDRSAGHLTLAPTAVALRQHALLFAVRVPATARLAISMREAHGEWEDGPLVELARAGTYLGLVALDERERALDAVRVVVSGPASFEVFDLALLTYG